MVLDLFFGGGPGRNGNVRARSVVSASRVVGDDEGEASWMICSPSEDKFRL